MRVLSNEEMGEVGGGWFWCWWGYRTSCTPTTTTCNPKPTCDPKPVCDPKPTCDPKPSCGGTTPSEPPQVP